MNGCDGRSGVHSRMEFESVDVLYGPNVRKGQVFCGGGVENLW